MRFGRINTNKGPKFARISGYDALLFDAAPWLGGKETGERAPFEDAMLLAPVQPGKVLCVGRNYAAHAKELGNEVPKEPLLFLKPSSAIIGHGEAIVLPPESSRVEHEVELAVVIGTRAKRVAAKDALSHVFGYTIGGDITARDLQRSDGQWSRGKGFDTFCPVGPWIENELDASNLRVKCVVNDAPRQDGSTSSMIFALPELIAYMSAAMTLEPGDLLLTGTPEGVGPLQDGDTIAMTIEGIGTLRCPVKK